MASGSTHRCWLLRTREPEGELVFEKEREDRLLSHALSRGLLKEQDVGSALPSGTDSSAVATTLRYGPRVDRLVASGRLTEGQIERLLAEMSAFDRTLDGKSAAGEPTASSSLVSVQFPAWLVNSAQYEVLGLLGQGGMGMVYRARDRKLAREVALKFISVSDESLRKRFLTEARSQARLNHENICKVFEVGELDGHPYIAMELVGGQPLSHLHRSLNREQKLTLMRDIAQAVHAAHSAGIIHRDLKPSNVMVASRDDGGLRPVVMDFGLARDQSSDEHLTMTGMVMGTPAYMSPEQAQGEVNRIDRRSDVYSLGAMMYELLAGQLPFAGATTVAMILQVVSAEPPPLRKVNPELPLDLETIVAKAMAKEIQRRYETARALAEDLDRFLRGEPILARKASLLYRAVRRAQKHRAVVIVSSLLLLSIVSLLALYVRSRVLAARERDRSARQAEFAQQLGQDITQMELFMRAAYMLPAHDIRREQNEVRNRIRRIADKLGTIPKDLRGPALYALGRGHNVLAEHDTARRYLEQALAEGYGRPEVHVTLGLSLGFLYQKGIQQAKQELDPKKRQRIRQKLEEELLAPTKGHLKQSAGTATDSAKLAAGWLHFYQAEYAQAESCAKDAVNSSPWDFQPLHLLAVLASQRTEQLYVRGNLQEAETQAKQAEALLNRLADMVRSWPQAYKLRLDYYAQRQGRELFEHRDMEQSFQAVLRLCDELSVVLPDSVDDEIARAGAYSYLARRQQAQGVDPRSAAKQVEDNVDAAERAGAEVALLNLLRNNTLLAIAAYADQHGEDPRPYLLRAASLIEKSVAKAPGAAILWNDLCATMLELSSQSLAFGADPSAFLNRGFAACEEVARLSPDFYVGLENHASLLRSAELVKFQNGQPATTEPALKMIERAETLKPGDSGILLTKIEILLLEAQLVAQRKENPVAVLDRAEQIGKQLRTLYPDPPTGYLALLSVMQTRLKLMRNAVDEATLLSVLAICEEGLHRHPQDIALRQGKAELLVYLAQVRGPQRGRAAIQQSLSILSAIEGNLRHRADYHATRARAFALSAQGLTGNLQRLASETAQQARQQAKQLNPGLQEKDLAP